VVASGAAAGLLRTDLGARQQAGRAARSAATARTTVILLGTQGGPNVNLARGQHANAVVVDDIPYLVDCGYGTMRALVQAGLRANDVSQVFLTHLHDDHTLDLAALLSLQWTAGTAAETTVQGPFGTEALIQAALAYLKPNADIRVTDEGRPNRPEALFSGRNLTAPKATQVFRDERVTVRAVQNTHFPERAMITMPYRSLAYRFDTADRSIVFSGDTASSDALVDLASSADVFVCETIEMALFRQLSQRADEEEARTGNHNSLMRHIVETHSTTEDVGRMAAAAGVKTVVLSHLLPGSNPARGGELPDSAYIDDVRRFFDGEVIVGRDGMRI
jgi:ribonuclease BN (tRNA processing enzyme)